MPDPYASIAETDPALQERLAEALELRAADPVQESMMRAHLSELSLPQGAKILEVGSGTGAVSRALAGLPNAGSVVGVDPSSIFVARAEELSRGFDGLSFRVGDGQALDFAGDSFDLVAFHTTLCHVPDPEKTLREARRVLKPGGQLAIFDGDYVTSTVAIRESDPLQMPFDAVIRAFVEHPWLGRRLPGLLHSMGMEVLSFKTHGYTKVSELAYFVNLLERGLDLLVADGVLGAEAAQALRGEAQRRQADGSFFGHISYLSVVSRLPL
jgi:SAM-dependent methyltransferase